MRERERMRERFYQELMELYGELYFELRKKEWLPGHKEAFGLIYDQRLTRLRKVGDYFFFTALYNPHPVVIGVNEDGRLFIWVSPTPLKELFEPKGNRDIWRLMGYDDEVSAPVAVLRADGKRYRVQGDVIVWVQPQPLLRIQDLARAQVTRLLIASLENSLVDFLASKGVTARVDQLDNGFAVWLDVRATQEVLSAVRHIVNEWKETVTCLGVKVGVNVEKLWLPDLVNVRVTVYGHYDLERNVVQEVVNAFKNEEATWTMKIGRHRVRCVNCAPRAVTLTFKSPLLDILNGLENEEYSVTVTLPPRTVYAKKGSRLVFEHPEHKTKTLIFEGEALVEVGTIPPSPLRREVNYFALLCKP